MEGFIWFLFTVGFFFGLIFVVSATKFVSQGHAGIVERMGKYVKTVGPGVHFLTPIFSRMVRVSLKEQVDHYAPQPVITKDNLMVNVDAVLFFRVIEPKRAVYDVESYVQALETMTMTTLRDVIGSMTLSDCLKSREDINARLRTVLDERSGGWGVKVTGVEIKSIDPPRDFREAMEQEKRAEIQRNAAILTADGQKKAAITQAEGAQQAAIIMAEGESQALRNRAAGERDAARLRAEGRAAAYKSLFGAIKNADIDNQVIAVRYLEALEKVATGTATTLILPYDSANVLSAVAQVAQTMAAVKGSSGDKKPVVEPVSAAPTPADRPSEELPDEPSAPLT